MTNNNEEPDGTPTIKLEPGKITLIFIIAPLRAEKMLHILAGNQPVPPIAQIERIDLLLTVDHKDGGKNDENSDY